jgi:proteasome lid subunit RPN8/RPN11
MKISPALVEEIVAHALADPRNEVCGVVAIGGDGVAAKVFRAENVHHSPMKFEIAPKELLELNGACEEIGELGAIYHSHVRSAPYPSQTDINFAANWPGVEWIIVGLSSGADPDVRSYLIKGADVTEVPVEDG